MRVRTHPSGQSALVRGWQLPVGMLLASRGGMWHSFPALATAVALLFGAPASPSAPVRPAPETVSVAAATAAPTVTDSERREASEVLETLKSQYRGLDQATVEFGDTPEGHEAVAYYATGKIVISDEHTVEIQKILAHEIWHVIDYGDNGHLDWGEDLPPANASDYLTR